MIAEKEKREGLEPSQRAEREPGERGTLSRKRGGTREETISRSEDSISFEKQKIKRVCENLLEYAAACRYGISRGERYVALPMTEEDAELFEFAAELLRELLSGSDAAEKAKRSGKGKCSPVGAFRALAEETGCAELSDALIAFEEMRNRKKKPMTDVARSRIVAKLKGVSSDPKVWAEILMQSVDNAWTGVFALKADKREMQRSESANSSFETDEFFNAALRHSMALFEQG